MRSAALPKRQLRLPHSKKALAVAALLLLGLTPAQERGRQIYFHGESRSGRAILVTVGEGGTPFSAAIVPCVNCHGEEGRGRVEANVRPSDITPDALDRAATVNGRTRPRYTRPHLKRAIGMGFDSGRNPLNAAMPRYTLSQDDASDLLDFLAILGRTPQPGITDDTIRIGVIGDDALTASDARIYGRRIELVHDRVEDVFLCIDASNDSRESIAAAERESVPTIVVQSSETVTGRWAFSLTASIDEQREALRAYARRINAEPFLPNDCGSIANASLVLLTADVASRCDLAAFPSSLDRRIIIAAPLPPDAAATRAAANAALAMATNLLAQLGRDVTRATFVDALEHTHRLETPTLPPLTFTANRHTATRAAWLMTLDLKTQRVLATPGWVE